MQPTDCLKQGNQELQSLLCSQRQSQEYEHYPTIDLSIAFQIHDGKTLEEIDENHWTEDRFLSTKLLP